MRCCVWLLFNNVVIVVCDVLTLDFGFIIYCGCLCCFDLFGWLVMLFVLIVLLLFTVLVLVFTLLLCWLNVWLRWCVSFFYVF